MSPSITMVTPSSSARHNEKLAITGAILAGGRGSRLAGQDKGWIQFKNKPLIRWLMEIFEPQVDTLIISANRNIPAYQALGWPVISDRQPGFLGPLAGIQACLANMNTPWALFVPCDTPFIPKTLASRLARTAIKSNAPLAIVQTSQRRHYAHTLIHRSLLPSLTTALDNGQRGLARWQQQQKPVFVDFEGANFEFANINTPQQLAQLESSL